MTREESYSYNNWTQDFPWLKNQEVDWLGDTNLCFPGWILTIYNGINIIQNIINENPTLKVFITGVKEKYGEFRIYVLYEMLKDSDKIAAEEIDKVIDIISEETKNTCFSCGKIMEKYLWDLPVCGGDNCGKKA